MSQFTGYKRSIVLDFNYDQVKQGVPYVNKQMALLNSEFKLASERAAQAGNSFDQLGLKQDRLSAAVAIQSQKVNALKADLDKLTSSEKNNERAIASKTIELNNAKSALLKMQKELQDTTEEVNKQKKPLEALKMNWSDFKSELKEGGIDIDGAANGFKKMAAVAVGLATGLTALGQNVASNAYEIQRLSDATGMSTEQYQQWDYILKMNNYSMEQASGDFANLSEKMLEAKSRSGESYEMFTRLGMSVTDNTGKLKSQSLIFEQLVNNLSDVSNATERNAIASALLGSTGEALMPILSKTSEELDGLKGKANIISQEDIDKGVEFNQMWIDFTATLKKFVSDIGYSALPAIKDSLNDVMGYLSKNEKTISNVGEIIGIVTSGLGFLLAMVLQIPAPILAIAGVVILAIKAFNSISSTIEATTGTIGKVGKAFGESADPVTKWTMIIVGAVAAITLLVLALNVLFGKSGEMKSTLNSMGESVGNLTGKVNKAMDGVKKPKGYAIGTQYVPEDGIYDVHQNERVFLPKGASVTNPRQTAEDNKNASVDMEQTNILLRDVKSGIFELIDVYKNQPKQMQRLAREGTV